MSSPQNHRAFFGDGEHDFRLTAPLILELERKTGCGIAVLFQRLFHRSFSLTDLHEIIRCALIGGGTDPRRADQLIATYAVDRPISETLPIAIAIAELHWFGLPNEETK
ncbi:conserved hypothetical protein [Rhodopseudomonas palustris TIE-1]|uniref:gene transfer agent family protein n=1 Tax=Rhodopseudomonas palustris TaxID=1076 RepID=UPI000164B414|nr:gene transfer agent family protein [Rhodopseudomonas palustris]ACF02473.1 conserved hypothetical protein [Rhodopseudomonas palustris TIE-1]